MTRKGGVIFIVCLLATLAYGIFVQDEPYWLDAPEFIAASYNLAQAHPPGHPLVCLLAKGLMLLPIGDIVLRANLFSGIFMALSVYVLGLILLSLISIFGENSVKANTLLLVLLLSFAFCPSAFIQALSIEVYSFNLALTLLSLFFAMQGPQMIGLVAICLGLGISNHHYLTLLALPAVLVLLCTPKNGFSKRFLLAFFALSYVTACAYLYLWIRGFSMAFPAWEDTTNLEGLLWVVSARVFAGSLGGFTDISALLTNLQKAMSLIMGATSPILPVLALGGVYVLVRNRSNSLALSLILLAVGGFASKVLMTIVDPQNPDDHGYFMLAICASFALACVFLARVLSVLKPPVGRASMTLVTGFVFTTVGFLLVWSVGSGVRLAINRIRSAHEPMMVMHRIFDEQPLHSVLFLSHYPIYFQALYLQGVEGMRPDLTIVQTSFYRKARGGGFYAMRMKQIDPDLNDIALRFMATQSLDRNALLDLASKRKIRFDPDPALFSLPLMFCGWTWELTDNNEMTVPMRVQSFIEDIDEIISDVNQVETKRVIVRNLSASACLFLHKKEFEFGQILVETARKVAPLDRTLLALAEATRYKTMPEVAKDFCNLRAQ